MTEEKNLKDAIDKISGKKHVISKDALEAKQEMDEVKKYTGGMRENTHDLYKRFSVIEEFDKSIQLLIRIFHQSSFDEMAYFISCPSKVMVINLLIGIIRGIGFAVGVSFIVFFLMYLIKASGSASSFTDIINNFQAFTGLSFK